MSRRKSNQAGTARTIEFPGLVANPLTRSVRRYEPPLPAPRPEQAREESNANRPVPDLTTGELSAILFDHLRADDATRDKALAILQTIEAERQKKAAAYACPTCRRPYVGESGENNSNNQKGKRSK